MKEWNRLHTHCKLLEYPFPLVNSIAGHCYAALRTPKKIGHYNSCISVIRS